MRANRIPAALGGSVRRFGLRHKTAAAFLGGSLAVLPTVAVTTTAADWVNVAGATDLPGYSDELAVSEEMPLEGGYSPEPTTLSVDGSLPDSPDPADLAVYQPPEPGPHGIPSTALKAYRAAARIVGREYPGCNIDWALIASIGRIESNHARGGYVDAKGDTVEPILGPVLNGVGPVAAIADTDDGRFDGDRVWDRAVGPTQFIPGTWARYGADGNGDGVRNPNNIYDATVATARYLCSGGLDLAKEDQLRAALYRYNNSDTYVDTVIRWAEAYRGGVRSLPDSDVPLAVPTRGTTEAPSPVDPRPPSGQATTSSAEKKPAAPRGELPADTTSPSSDPELPPSVNEPSSPSPSSPSSPDETPDTTVPPESTEPSDSTETCEPTADESPDSSESSGSSGSSEQTDSTDPTTPPCSDPEDEPTEPRSTTQSTPAPTS
ncbi:membrane-bound lytic murein transglycosylase B [Prauserella shujinwangii]|uniref:Membrane-bound lytic murein transglycosylase B n=1 Tax=Prauserella shujinwangii TaxID=1453103 RepID=A0A2T0M016_9PSEU|nr:lytic murein transglycosylase [Prauserella shujinwangii]PRX49946.1 membrane-bound lytic murein transglycosylase B [Prauserella shujinwangii]